MSTLITLLSTLTTPILSQHKWDNSIVTLIISVFTSYSNFTVIVSQTFVLYLLEMQWLHDIDLSLAFVRFFGVAKRLRTSEEVDINNYQPEKWYFHLSNCQIYLKKNKIRHRFNRLGVFHFHAILKIKILLLSFIFFYRLQTFLLYMQQM